MAMRPIKKLCRACCPCGGDEVEPAAYLYAFDFDHTIVDQNSDAAVMGVLHEPIPESLLRIYDGTNWEEYMEEIFKFAAGAGATPDNIVKQLGTLKPTEGMEHLLQRICNSKSINHYSRFIVISDANTFFIQSFLQNRTPPLIPDAIISNYAKKNQDGTLKLKPYEYQNTCPLCPRNLCKGKALLKYIQLQGPFNRVYYVGDGGNDICPAMKLNKDDVVFVRRNFAMEKILMIGVWKGVRINIKAKIVFWDDARRIEEEVEFY